MMLYDGVVRFTEQARAALEKKDWEASYTMISRAQKIITELTCTLRHDVDPELCGKLAALYNYAYRKLVEASVEHQLEAIDEALRILRYQRDTWALLLDQIGKKKAASAAAGIDMPAPDQRMEASISMRG